MPWIRTASRWTWAALLMMAVTIPLRAGTQQSEEDVSGKAENTTPEKKRLNPALPRLAIDTQTGVPGTNVVVPLYFSPPQAVELRAISVEIEWVSKNLKFVRLEKGISAEAIGAQVNGKVTGPTQEAKSIEHSTLRIDVTTDKDAKKGIPDGLLAYLTFQVSADAQPFAIELRPKLVSAESVGAAGKKFTQAEVQTGKVNVELPGLPPYVTCFFFSH